MNRRRIPHSDLDVSTLCLGTMTFGSPVTEADAIRIVHWALDHGINFIDTADMYEGYARVPGSAGGVAEAILGASLFDRRERAIITTKVGNAVGAGPDDKGLGRSHILRQIDASLRRMRLSHVDIYELHRPDPVAPLAESIQVMSELIDTGKIRHWGFSNFSATQIEEMIQLCDSNSWPRPVISQPPYSWLNRDIEKAELPACVRYEIAVTPYQPLQGGLLSGKYRRGSPPPDSSRAAENSRWLPAPDEALFDRLEAFEHQAEQRRLSPSQYAIQWLLEKPGVTSVVVGVKSIEQLGQLLESQE